jgi:hypothetical protein
VAGEQDGEESMPTSGIYTATPAALDGEHALAGRGAQVYTYSVSEQRLLELLDGLALPRPGATDPAFAGLLNALNRRAGRPTPPPGAPDRSR